MLPLALDLTEPEQVRHVVRQAHAHFGKLDVMLNNTGYTLVGTVEEASQVEFRALFETNFFGAASGHSGRPALLREQGDTNSLASNRWEEVLCKLPSFPP